MCQNSQSTPVHDLKLVYYRLVHAQSNSSNMVHIPSIWQFGQLSIQILGDCHSYWQGGGEWRGELSLKGAVCHQSGKMCRCAWTVFRRLINSIQKLPSKEQFWKKKKKTNKQLRITLSTLPVKRQENILFSSFFFFFSGDPFLDMVQGNLL